jgi:hypothetical protein
LRIRARTHAGTHRLMLTASIHSASFKRQKAAGKVRCGDRQRNRHSCWAQDLSNKDDSLQHSKLGGVPVLACCALLHNITPISVCQSCRECAFSRHDKAYGQQTWQTCTTGGRRKRSACTRTPAQRQRALLISTRFTSYYLRCVDAMVASTGLLGRLQASCVRTVR